MRILMQNRYDALTHKGGDTYQMLFTKKYLEKLGVAVDISTELQPDLANYDIVHLFNITRVHETYIQHINAKKCNKKIILSPIYHSVKDIENYERKNLGEPHRTIAKILGTTDRIQLAKTFYYAARFPGAWNSFAGQAARGYTNQQKEVLRNADLVIPNSEMEQNAINEELFSGKDTGIHFSIVYNGVNELESDNSLNKISRWLETEKLKDIVLCAGRIEPRKNQLNIIESLQGSGYDFVMAGRINKLHSAYGKKVLGLAKLNPRLHYLEELSQVELMTLYKSAKVAVNASWFETTGLTGLEAGALGCNVVMTEKGYTKEYYKDHAWYCDPEDIKSIGGAIRSAFEAPRDKYMLKEYIVDNGLTWENAAAKTLQCYEKVFNT